MSKILVVKAKSRMGLKNFPFGGDPDRNIGVEQGPDVLVAAGVFAPHAVEMLELDFPAPEAVPAEGYLGLYAEHLRAGTEAIAAKLTSEHMLINLGGDHSVAFMSLLARIKQVGAANLGYIQIDSHGDVHSYSSSPSGNFHGMWMRPFLGAMSLEEIDALVPGKLGPTQVMYLGNLNLEAAETEFLDQNHVQRYGRSELSAARAVILDFIESFPSLHVSIDVDAFDKTIAPGTGIKAEAGLFFEDVQFVLEAIKQHSDASLDLVEYNPLKDADGLTLQLLRDILRKVID